MKKYNNPHVPTSQFSPEFEKLLGLYGELKPKTVLEIGSEYGGTLWHWLHMAEPGTKVVNVDLNLVPSMAPKDLMWQSWAPEDVELHTIFGFSQDERVQKIVFELLGEIDFCFIDGDHTYKGAALDWHNYGKKAKVTAFHDLVRHQPHFGVSVLWQEIKEEYRTEEFWSRQGQQGGGIGVVYVSDRT